MHLLLRTLLMLFTSARRSALTIWDSSSLPLRVLPTDIDIAMHVNNGMYFSLMDLGRFDLMVRSGVWKTMRQRGWSPVAAGETIAFRKSLQLWQQYTIETKIIGLDAKAIYFEQRMVSDGEIYARAYIATRLVNKGRPVSQDEILREFGQPRRTWCCPNGSTNGVIPTPCPAAGLRLPTYGTALPGNPRPELRSPEATCRRRVCSPRTRPRPPAPPKLPEPPCRGPVRAVGHRGIPVSQW
ncbi:protein THEM6 [Arthrobacter sp. Hiyo4]|nr:protein THEM6 [Arthrobacter sp. Hiyo4]